jgi:hypothetical protein
MIARLAGLFALVIVITNASGGAGAEEAIHRLQVVGADGVSRWEAPIRSGEPFDVLYVHSSEHCQWTQHYRAGPGTRITQPASTFPCFGPGMPAGGEVIRRSTDGFTVSAGFALKQIDLMNWMPARIALRYRHQTIPVGPWFADYDIFSIRIR